MWIPWAYFGVIQHVCLDALVDVMDQRVKTLGQDTLPDSFQQMLLRFHPQDPTDKSSW